MCWQPVRVYLPQMSGVIRSRPLVTFCELEETDNGYGAVALIMIGTSPQIRKKDDAKQEDSASPLLHSKVTVKAMYGGQRGGQ